MKLQSVLSSLSCIAAMTGTPLLFAHQTKAAPALLPSGMMAQVTLQFGSPHVQLSFGDDQRRELRHIYWELEKANRDYNGHRSRAMEEVRKAGEILGLDLHGEGYGRGPEPQEWSDTKLSEAHDQLADLSSRTAGPVRDHLREAAHQLKAALEVQVASPLAVQSSFGDDQRRELRHIYWELENANRDYNGHRSRALEDIRRAGEILGMNLHGEGYGHRPESLEWSNGKLREAHDQLADLARRTSGPEHERLRHAAEQLDRALETQ